MTTFADRESKIMRLTAVVLTAALLVTLFSTPVLAGDNDGLVWGAILGGVAGGVIGHQSDNTGAGIAIGILVGGLIGHMIDNSREKEEQRYEEQGSHYREGLKPIDSLEGAEFGMSVSDARNALPSDLSSSWEQADQALDGDMLIYEAARGSNNSYLYMFYRGRLFAMAQQRVMRESLANVAYNDALDNYGAPTTYYDNNVPNWYDYNTKGFMYIDQKALGKVDGENQVQWVQFVTYQPTFDNVQPEAEDERFVGDHFFRETT